MNLQAMSLCVYPVDTSVLIGDAMTEVWQRNARKKLQFRFLFNAEP